jgi:hypothetical protein
MEKRVGWRAFAEWALALALLAFALITLPSIGMFIFPFALLAIALAARRNRAWPEAATGGPTGVGTICLYLAFVRRGYSPCPEMPIRIQIHPGESGSGSFSCGGLQPLPFLTVGLLLVAAGVAGYLVLRQRRLAAAAP